MRLLSAGQRRREHFDQYASRVRSFDWRDFYEHWEGSAYLEFFRQDLVGTSRDDPQRFADILLIDSRTGVTEQSGVCTHHLADAVILFSGPNRASIDGCRWMAEALRSPALLAARHQRPLKLLPVAGRVEVTAEKEILADFETAFSQRLTGVAADAIEYPGKFLHDGKVPYVPFYSFLESVSAREPEDRRHNLIYNAYETLTNAIEECGSQIGLLHASRARVPGDPQSSLFKSDVLITSGESATAESIASLVTRLRTYGLSVWSQAEAFRGVTDWLDQWEERARTSDGVVLVLGTRQTDQRALAEISALIRARSALPKPLHLVVVGPGEAAPSYLLRCGAFVSSSSEDLEAAINRQLVSDASLFTLDSSGTGSPYPGLNPYGESEARYFFGRDEDIRKILSTMIELGVAGKPASIVVAGASHCGKTSLVHAGVVPALRRFRSRPLQVVALVANETTSRPYLQELVVGDPNFETRIRFVVDSHSDAGRDVLLLLEWHRDIDGLDDAHRREIGRVIAELLLRRNVLVISTTRSSTAGRAKELIGASSVIDIYGLSDKTFPATITNPLAIAGGMFEYGLIERIVSDAMPFRASPGIVNYAMQMLWRSRRSNLITHRAYSSINGIGGVFYARADEYIMSLTNTEANGVKDLLLVLESRKADDWDRDRLIGDVAQVPGKIDWLDELSRLGIIQMRGPAIEFVDARRVSQWWQFSAWWRLETAMVERRRRVELQARRWHIFNRPRWALPDEQELAEFTDLTHLSALATEYLWKGRRVVERRRRIRRFARTAAIAVLVGATVWGAGELVLRSKRQNRADSLVRESRAILLTDPARSLELALAAGRTWNSDETRAQILETAKRSRLRADFKLPAPAASLAVLEDRLFAAGSTAVSIFDLKKGNTVWTAPPVENAILSAVVTPAGDYVLAALNDAPPVLWEVQGSRRAITIGSDPMTAVAFSPDGDSFVIATTAALRVSAQVGTTAEPLKLRKLYKKEFGTSVGLRTEFFKGGNRVVSTGYGGAVTIWDPVGGSHIKSLITHEQTVSFLALSPVGVMVTATAGGDISVWEGTSGELRGIQKRMPRPSHGSTINDIALSPDGSTLIVGNDAEIRSFGTADDMPGTLFRARGATTVAFSPNGEQLAIGDVNGMLDVIAVKKNSRMFVTPAHKGAVQKIVYSTNGRLIATSGSDARARVWDTDEPREEVSDVIAFGQDRLPITTPR